MSTKPAFRTEAPVTMWETFEGHTYGYNEAGTRIVEITAATRATAWSVASNVRGWSAHDEHGAVIATGEGNGLRESKRAALAAVRAHQAPAEAPKAPARTDLTTADLDRMADHEDWHGFGYLGERQRTTAPAAKVAAADMDALDAANQRGMTYDQLFEWANSKNGRWYADCAFGTGRHASLYLPGAPAV